VITTHGEHRYGKVIDSWEVGVKHLNLAQGDDCCCAGEIKISRKGHVTFNLLSGTFTSDLIRKGHTTLDELVYRTTRFFRSITQRQVRYTPDSLFVKHLPSVSELAKIRRLPDFARRNELLCAWIDTHIAKHTLNY
jgi:hypothetical protein